MTATRLSVHWDRLWNRLSYQSKPAEAVLTLLLISGLPLWSVMAAPWNAGRLLLFAHVALSLLLFPLFVLPFWLAHRAMLRRPGRPLLHWTGRIIEALIVIAFASGLWLVLAGNPGEIGGSVAYYAHLSASLPFGLLLAVHGWRYSLLRRGGLAVLVLLFCLFYALPSLAGQPVQTTTPQSSRALLPSPDGTSLYSANAQAGSVSRIAVKDGAILAEQALGGTIERLALDAKGDVVLATDPVGGKIHLLHADSLKPIHSLSQSGRPFGAVYDARHQWFWVTLFEDHRLLAVDRHGRIRQSLAVAETPRGLALLSDGRLLITHAMIGQVSLYDSTTATASTPPTLIKTITLHESQDPVETVSQGVPRLLDQIAVSPDETEAWLPHVLWNFDHPFQFQSTVFPTISLLSLEKGKEQEATEHRKHLFQQINILEDGTRTRIVSNPFAAEFSANGGQVFVTAAASEDLLVFDRSRAGGLTRGELRGRRVGKASQGGAKAVQILRHLPGDNPRGLVRLGNQLYVQNAMSLDVSRLSLGDDPAFAVVSVDKDHFADLTRHDPMAGSLRRGWRLFHNGNSDDFPDQPMTGDNWMSCQSCHVDGFNFTNTYLTRDAKLDKSTNAVPGHANLKRMVAGDFVGDYLRMVRDTQGGMGADTRFPTPDTNPDQPNPTANQMMQDLHQVVIAKENLPFLSTWLRIDDPRPTIHAEEWINSAACAGCHQEMFDQWADSLHRMMANSNPYYRVVEDVAAKTEGEDFRLWCLGCHQPQGVTSGLRRTTGPLNLFEKGATSLVEAHKRGETPLEDGTGCLMCHRITKLEDASPIGGGNASLTINLKDRANYVFEQARDGLTGWLGRMQINAKPDIHTQSYSQPFYKDPKLCATCHGEFTPGSGAVIVDTYGEWAASPFNRPDDPSQNRTCIDCHMHGDIARIGQNIPGTSTKGGRLKDNVVTHQFTGANHHLVGLRNEKLGQMSIDLLKSAARLEIQPADSPKNALTVRVKNVGAGHALPTGVADFREMWLDVTLTDANGQEILRSGHLNPDGSLPETGTRMFRKVFADQHGQPVGLRFWRMEKLLEKTMIPAGGFRDEAFDLPATAAYPLTAKVRLMFRIYPQWVTNAVRGQFPELPIPQPVEMAHITHILERPQP